MLFIEHAPFEPGVETELLVHVTRLEDHSAVAEGTLTVRLQHTADTARASQPVAPARPGIFRPRIAPASAGHAELVVSWRDGETTETWTPGEVSIGDHGHAHSQGAESSDQTPISYLLEQQWTRPFGVAEAEVLPMAPELTVFGHLQIPESARSTVTATVEGRLVPVGERIPLPGDSVAVGQELFSVQTALPSDHDPVEVASQLDSSIIERDAALREMERVEPLVQQGVLPSRRLTEVQTRLAQAESAVSIARRRSASIQRASSLTQGDNQRRAILAPFSGRVIEVLTSPNAWVQEGDALLRVIQTDNLWLSAMVPEVWVSQLGSLQGASFQIDHQESAISLGADALISVAPAIDEATHSLPVLFQVPPEVSQGLVAGMTAVVRLITGEHRDVLSVPSAALVDDNGTDVVFVQSSGESFERRSVETGMRSAGRVEILGGVIAGERVVTEGAWAVRLAGLAPASADHGHAH
jgi:RND family efflux transporter MFP subunit